jgi:alpha-mannosidase
MLEFPQAHIPCFWGVSDHGGGISRQELALIREYQQEHDIVFATMAEYFDVVKDLPMEEFSGEIGPVFRGCYSNCHEVKRKISRAVRRMNTAQRLGVEAEKLSPAWRELLFHHFHDILPGTSVRRAFERDIFTGLGMVEHQADLEIDRALFRRSCSLESSFLKQGGIYCRNLHTFKFRNVISMDGFTDPDFTGKNFNVLRDAQGNEYPLQILPAATSYGPCGVPWGRLTATVELPAFGEKVLAYGVTDKDFGRTGFERQHELLRRLSFEMYPDDSRTWGFELEKFSGTPEKAVLSEVRELCDGAVCSVLQAFYRIGNSSVRVDLYSWRDLPEMGVHIALNWHDESSCVKVSNSFGRYSLLIPMPVSAMVKRRVDWFSYFAILSTVRSTLPPSGVNLTALPSILIST